MKNAMKSPFRKMEQKLKMPDHFANNFSVNTKINGLTLYQFQNFIMLEINITDKALYVLKIYDITGNLLFCNKLSIINKNLIINKKDVIIHLTKDNSTNFN